MTANSSGWTTTLRPSECSNVTFDDFVPASSIANSSTPSTASKGLRRRATNVTTRLRERPMSMLSFRTNTNVRSSVIEKDDERITTGISMDPIHKKDSGVGETEGESEGILDHGAGGVAAEGEREEEIALIGGRHVAGQKRKKLVWKKPFNIIKVMLKSKPTRG